MDFVEVAKIGGPMAVVAGLVLWFNFQSQKLFIDAQKIESKRHEETVKSLVDDLRCEISENRRTNSESNGRWAENTAALRSLTHAVNNIGTPILGHKPVQTKPDGTPVTST